MTTEEQLKELLDEILEALTFNKSILPTLVKVGKANMTLTFEANDYTKPYLVRATMTHGEGRRGQLLSIAYVDVEVLSTSVFYTPPKIMVDWCIDCNYPAEGCRCKVLE